MLQALIAFLTLSIGVATAPVSAGQDEVPILANKIILNEQGKPLEMIFDPATYGAGLELFEGQETSWLPSKCLFGSRDAKHEDESVTRLIREGRDKAEASVGRQVARVSYCKLEPIVAEIHGFKPDAGLVLLPWRSLWGEGRTFRMWYSVNDDTILLFSFVGDA